MLWAERELFFLLLLDSGGRLEKFKQVIIEVDLAGCQE